MDQFVWATARKGFVNQRIGAISKHERAKMEYGIASELERMGLVVIDRAPARHVENVAAVLSRRWEGATVVIVCSGPSLTDEQLDVAHQRQDENGWKVIAVNDNWRRSLGADVLYACDDRWWDKYHAEITTSEFGGELWTQDNKAAQRYGLRHVRGEAASGLGRRVVHHGNNSGYQAINLAYLWGVRRVVLLGMDMQIIDGKRHWFGDHPRGLNKPSPYKEWVKKFDQLSIDLLHEGVEVINCSPVSALTCFPVVAIADVAP